MTTTLVALLAGGWTSDQCALVWRTLLRLLEPERAAGGTVTNILHPVDDVAIAPTTSEPGQSATRALALLATDTGPTAVVAPAADPAAGRFDRFDPALVLTGRDLRLSDGEVDSAMMADVGPGGSVRTDRPSFLALFDESGDGMAGSEVGDGPVAVVFDRREATVHTIRGVRALGPRMTAECVGREIFRLNGRTPAVVLAERTAEFDRPDMFPEQLLIGSDRSWRRVLVLDPRSGTLVLDGDICANNGEGPQSLSVSLALPDPLDAVLELRNRIGPGQRAVVALPPRQTDRSDHSVDVAIYDALADMRPLLVPGCDLEPGSVRATVFGPPHHLDQG